MAGLFDYFRQVVTPQPRQMVPPPQQQVQRSPTPPAAAAPTPIQPTVVQPQSTQSAAIAARYGTRYAGYEELITQRPGGGYDLRAADAAIAADLRREEVQNLSGYGLTRYQFQQAGEARRQAVSQIQAARGNIPLQQSILPRYQQTVEREWGLGLQLERGWLRGEIPPTGPTPPRVGRSVLQVRGEMPTSVLPEMTPITAIPKSEFKQPTEESPFTPTGLSGSLMGFAGGFAGFAGTAVTKTLKLGDFPTTSLVVERLRTVRNLVAEQVIKAEVAAPIGYAASPLLTLAMGEQIIKDPFGFIPSTISSIKTGLETEPGFTLGMLYGSGKGGEAILKATGGPVKSIIQPRFEEAKILVRTPRSQWGPTRSAVNIFQNIKGIEVRGASTPDLAKVLGVGPKAAPKIEAFLRTQPHSIYGRAVEIGQMPPEWIAPRGYTYDVDLFLTGEGKTRLASVAKSAGLKEGVFDPHSFPEGYPVGKPGIDVEYAAKKGTAWDVMKLPKSTKDLLFTKTDPFKAVEIGLRERTGLFSMETAVFQKPSGKVIPTLQLREFGKVTVKGELPRDIIDWHTHPRDIFTGGLLPSAEELAIPSATDIFSYESLQVREGRIVSPKYTTIIRPGPEGYFKVTPEGPRFAGTLKYREPSITAEIKTGLVAEKLRIQTGRKIASIMGEEVEGSWKIGPEAHRLKDVYDAMRGSSFLASEARAQRGIINRLKAQRIEKGVMGLKEFYGKPENIMGRYKPRDVAIFGKAIREFRIGEPMADIPLDIGEPTPTQLPRGYKYPSISRSPSFSETRFLPSPMSSSRASRSKIAGSLSPSILPKSPSFASIVPSRVLSPSRVLKTSVPKGSSILRPAPSYHPPSSPPSRPPSYPPSIPPYHPPSYPPSRPPTPPLIPTGIIRREKRSESLFYGKARKNILGAFGYKKWQAVLMPGKALSFRVKGLKSPKLKGSKRIRI